MNNGKQNYIIPNSFKYPLFNEAMEKELFKIIEWLKNEKISTVELNLTEHIITELISENRKLNKKIHFSVIYQKLSEQYKMSDFNKIYKDINQDIKIISYEISTIKPFMDYEHHELLRILSRCYFKKLCHSNNKYYEFLHLFFIELYGAYIFFTQSK